MGRELENIDLTIAQRKEIITLLKHYLPNTEVWAYGSRVKFTSRPSSDLDMVAFATPKQQMAIANLREAFEESPLPFRVDLFVWDEVPKQFHRNIEEKWVVVQRKKVGREEKKITSNSHNIRWEQRLEKFDRASALLEDACTQDSYSILEQAGLVKMFEFSFELAWKILKDLLFVEGYDEKTPRSVIRRSFETGYLNEEDAEIFLDALQKRNILSHFYEEKAAKAALTLIKQTYFPVLKRALNTLKGKQRT